MLEELTDYIIPLDDVITFMIDNNIAEKGIEKYLSQQLIYLDCSVIYKSGLRAMQTIGYPYRKEISSYLYAVDNCVNFMTVEDNNPDNFDKDYWISLLLDRHHKNLEYEKENPPIWYGGKKAKAKWDKDNPSKLPRKRKLPLPIGMATPPSVILTLAPVAALRLFLPPQA